MFRLIAPFVARLDAVYAEQSYFTRLKARLLAAFDLIVLVWVPVNVAKVLWTQPPFVSWRMGINAIIVFAAVWSFREIRRGRLARAGDTLALILTLPAHVLVILEPAHVEPLGSTLQL